MAEPTRGNVLGGLSSGWLRFGPLLAALSIAMLATDPLSEAGYGGLASAFTIPAILGGALLVIASAGRVAVIAVALWAALSVVDSVLVDSLHPAITTLGRIVDSLFVAFVAVVLLRRVMASREVSVDTILGGVSVYLFLALFFRGLFSTLEFLVPASFLDRGEVLVAAAPGQYAALSYFSLVTITTLGFGDVVPTTPLARSLSAAEAVVGQLYIAVLISFLVGVYISQRHTGTQTTGVR